MKAREPAKQPPNPSKQNPDQFSPKKEKTGDYEGTDPRFSEKKRESVEDADLESEEATGRTARRGE